MKNFSDYFTDTQLIRILAKKRARAAKNLHDDYFLKAISNDAPNPSINRSKEYLYSLLPRRNNWCRLNKKERCSHSSSLSINIAQIEKTVWIQKNNFGSCDEKPEWLKELEKFIISIQNKTNKSTFNYIISKPKLIPVIKDPVKKTYRLISVFDELQDQILIGQTAKYFTDLFDQLFDINSYAFRSSINEINYSHHLAIENIIKYKKDNIGCRFYVSECDIQKFYDSINHTVINERFIFLLQDLENKKITIDKYAIHIFQSYLNSYSFNHDVYPKRDYILKMNNIRTGEIPWVNINELEELGSNINNDRIGVPQGGALSCLIANIVLDYADRAIRNLKMRNLFYARFCDDIVLIHTQKYQSRKAFQTYCSSLKELRLPHHKPEEFDRYSKEFWDIKSKQPYLWKKNNQRHYLAKKNVPWLAFVGYHIRYDNKLRVRKSSVDKELEKQINEAGKLIRYLNKKGGLKQNPKNIKFRFEQRLLAMSVGRVNSKRKVMCWTSGFRVLQNHDFIKYDIKKLDIGRNKQIRRIRNKLGKIDELIDTKSKNKIRVRKYYGKPYCYFYQFRKSAFR